MLNLPIFYMVAIQIIATLTFAVLWHEDRAKRYFYWWTWAHFYLSVLTLLAYTVGIPDLNSPFLYLLGFNLCLSFNVVTFFIAAYLYRKSQFPEKLVFYIGIGLTLLLMLVAFLHSQQMVTLIAWLGRGAAFLFTAWALWEGGLLARLASLFFGMRGLNALLFVLFPGYADLLGAINAIAIVVIPATLISVLLLILSALQRSQSELKSHIKFLSLTQEITAALQGVTSAKQASRSVIQLLLKNQLWTNGGVLIPNKERDHLYLLSGSGSDFSDGLFDFLVDEGISLSSRESMSVKAFDSKRMTFSYDGYNKSTKAHFGDYIPDNPEPFTHVAMPLHYSERVFGVLFVSRITRENLLPEEMRFLESIGQVLGVTLANLESVAELAYRASHDALTGLKNRAALHEFFSKQPRQKRFVMMLFDLNHFKVVNDTLGHEVGDKMLCGLALRLQQELENNSTQVYRLGGDEFVVSYEVSPTGNTQEALALRLCQLIDRPLSIDGLTLRTSASIGVVDSQGRELDSHELLRCADLAMYQAKTQGIPIAHYHETSDDDVHNRAIIIAGITEGIEKGQLSLVFQPIIDLSTGKCRKCEGLIRWHHPEKGIISAADFMPLIESTSMISKIALIVVKQAVEATALWRGVTISINLSARNLLDDELIGFLLKTSAMEGFEASSIQLEITETMLMTDHIVARSVLDRLVDAGFSIALDDFGTGYSSLAYLSNFPIHTLKIDGSFTHKMMADSGTRSIVESTIELSHKLGIAVVAECVERPEEAAQLKAMGCQFAQGYLYSKPIASADFTKWLSNHNNL